MKELCQIQYNLKAPKNLFNKFGGFKYRSAEGILESVKPILHEANCTLTISDEMVSVGDRIYVKATAVLKNATGETETCTAFAREPESRKGMDESMCTGSSSSYARKYCLNGLFALDDSENDPDSVHGKHETPAKDPKAEMVEKILGDESHTIQVKLAGKVMLKDKKMTFQSEDGKNFYTFSTTIATKAKEAITKDIVISLTYTDKGKFGLEATDIQEVF